jgi:hypothetical protein
MRERPPLPSFDPMRSSASVASRSVSPITHTITESCTHVGRYACVMGAVSVSVTEMLATVQAAAIARDSCLVASLGSAGPEEHSALTSQKYCIRSEENEKRKGDKTLNGGVDKQTCVVSPGSFGRHCGDLSPQSLGRVCVVCIGIQRAPLSVSGPETGEWEAREPRPAGATTSALRMASPFRA